MQIANVCITLNEYPYIRYYMPAHHGPLGALRPHESTRVVQRPANENSLRWRTNLARGDQARQSEAAGEIRGPGALYTDSLDDGAGLVECPGGLIPATRRGLEPTPRGEAVAIFAP